MSSTESVHARTESTTPVQQSSLAKLRSISGRKFAAGILEDDRGGVLDAFSEVFARMAASEAKVIETVESDAQVDSSGDHAEAKSDENKSDESEA